MSLKLASFAFAITGLVFCTPANAWDGTDTNTGASVEIDRGQLVRSGETIEVYDSNEGAYKTYDIDSISRTGGTVEIEATDTNSGDSTTLEMDDN